MLGLRRATDQVFNRRAGDKLARGFERGLEEVRGRAQDLRERGNEAARSAYDYAVNNRRATAAMVLGTAMAAGLIWFMQRNGRKGSAPHSRRRSAKAQ